MSEVPPYKNANAPFIYFDIVAANGVMEGAIELELAARTLIPGAGTDVSVEIAPTAHLRCSPAAAIKLRESINAALDLLAKLQSDPNAQNAPKLN